MAERRSLAPEARCATLEGEMAMRAAIVHYWLTGMRGGEKVVEALCGLLPEADLFTLFYDPERVSETIRARRVTASYLNPLRRWRRSLLPFMPSALESFDLRGYDLIVSSESGPAKGVLAPSTARHVCYCHTPMRYLWELYPAYLHDWTRGAVQRAMMRPLARRLRLWDFASAARVDQFVANSENVRRRIWRTYRREAEVVYPPVAVDRFTHCPPGDYFLIVSELVAYKQLDYAVRALARSGRALKVVGEGPEYRALKRLASERVEFCGRVSGEELRGLYSRCRALVMPGEEDFGIAAVEALASGKPVLALGRGGVLETVPADPRGGLLYGEATEDALLAALEAFERAEPEFRPAELQAWAARFSPAAFEAEMRAILGLQEGLEAAVPGPRGSRS
jgi:glycosyltransferase involved in cell wall biosynthesis